MKIQKCGQKKFKYKFHYHQEKLILESDDPDVWIEPWKTTREKMYLYFLHWAGRKILFSAIAPYEEDKENDCYWIDWELQHVGISWLEVDPYVFESPEERMQAAKIIQECLWQYNANGNMGRSKVRSVATSEHLEKVLKGEIL